MPKIQFPVRTEFLNRRPAENICHAFDFARYLGTPLYRYVVVNFPASDADLVSWKFSAIRDKFRNWYNRRTRQLYGAALPAKYVYTLENPSGQRAHANWVVYIPPELAQQFDKKLRGWVRKVVRRDLEFDVHNQAVDPDTYKTLAKYVLKGLDPRYVNYLHLQDYTAPQGLIHGRRACASASLNRAARKAVGFVAKRDRNKVLAAANANSHSSVA